MPTILDLLEDGARESAFLRTIPGPVDAPSLAEVWRRSEDAGRFLTHRVGRGGSVGVLLASSSACVATLIGGWRAGLRVASLPLPAKALPLEEYVAQLGAVSAPLEIGLVVAEPALAAVLTGLPTPVATYEQALSGGPATPLAEAGSFVQCTSGSTSAPKGVVLTLSAIGDNISALLEHAGIPDPCVGCSWLPLSHDMGLVGMCLAVWAAQRGASSGGLVLLRPELFLRRPSAWLSACSEFGASVTATPTVGLDLALRYLRRSGPLDLSRLSTCIIGAEPLRAETLRRFAAELAPSGLDERALCPAYGMAEASLVISLKPPGIPWTARRVAAAPLEAGRWVECPRDEDAAERNAADRGDADRGAAELVALGPPVPRMEVAVDSPAAGSVAELRIRGPSLFERYIGDGTARGADGWFPTRDLGAVAGGQVYVTGRTDDVMVIAGRNLYAHDLEAAATVGGVRHRGVAAIPYGAGRYALVLERPRAAADESALKALCGGVRRAVAQRVGIGPVAVLVVAPGSLPRTPSGKPQRKRLAAQLASERLPLEMTVRFR